MRAIIPVLLAGFPYLANAQEDLRTAYDVDAYRLDLRFDPQDRRITGTVSIEVVVVAETLEHLELDLGPELNVQRVLFARGPLLESGPAHGKDIFFERSGERLECHLPRPIPRGKRLTLALTYDSSPGLLDRAHGVRWTREDGDQVLIDIAVQNVGAHHWFPCKASRFHPEDRPKRVLIDATVPDGLVAAANGRLIAREEPEPGWIKWRWRHDYPLPTYSVGLSIGAYETVTERLELPEHGQPVLFQYFVLPESLPAARVQLAEVGELLSVYSQAFGPWPFPKSKVGVAEGSWSTTEHSTLIGYGSSWPAFRAQQGEVDPNARWNRGYDYVLAHQLAHEWWGNAVGASNWRDYWLQEGLATFAEGLWLEHLAGREEADAFFRDLASRLPTGLRLLRTEAEGDARRAFSPVLYMKGAWVMHLARHYLDDDARFFGALRRFQREHRYGVACSGDLKAAFEAETGEDWGRFFDEWVYGTGAPRLEGEVIPYADRIEVRVTNQIASGGSFRVPLDLRWVEDGEPIARRVWLEPGEAHETLPCADRPEEVRVVNLQRLLGRHSVIVK
jgi:aminopeptidase N